MSAVRSRGATARFRATSGRYRYRRTTARLMARRIGRGFGYLSARCAVARRRSCGRARSATFTADERTLGVAFWEHLENIAPVYNETTTYTRYLEPFVEAADDEMALEHRDAATSRSSCTGRASASACNAMGRRSRAACRCASRSSACTGSSRARLPVAVVRVGFVRHAQAVLRRHRRCRLRRPGAGRWARCCSRRMRLGAGRDRADQGLFRRRPGRGMERPREVCDPSRRARSHPRKGAAVLPVEVAGLQRRGEAAADPAGRGGLRQSEAGRGRAQTAAGAACCGSIRCCVR